MNRNTKFIVAGALVFSLGGCQSILEPLGFGPRKDKDETRLADVRSSQDEYFVARLESGREDVRNGNYASAIDNFRHASLGQTTRADALNGLGVAYVGIGRLDLAKRYFYQAASLDPQDTRFAANIARLHRELNRVEEETMLARAAEEARLAEMQAQAAIGSAQLARSAMAVNVTADMPEVSLPQTAERAEPAPAVRIESRPRARVMANGAIRVERAPARINRINNREVAIVTTSPEEAAQQADYPVRIVLGEAPAGEE